MFFTKTHIQFFLCLSKENWLTVGWNIEWLGDGCGHWRRRLHLPRGAARGGRELRCRAAARRYQHGRATVASIRNSINTTVHDISSSKVPSRHGEHSASTRSLEAQSEHWRARLPHRRAHSRLLPLTRLGKKSPTNNNKKLPPLPRRVLCRASAIHLSL